MSNLWMNTTVGSTEEQSQQINEGKVNEENDGHITIESCRTRQIKNNEFEHSRIEGRDIRFMTIDEDENQ